MQTQTPTTYRQRLEAEFGRPPKPGHHLVRNLMTNKPVEIADDTPFCCDPSTERYWSM